jgi:hypothetical protein
LLDGPKSGPNAIRGKIKEILSEYDYMPDNQSETNEEDEKWPASFGRSVA